MTPLTTQDTTGMVLVSEEDLRELHRLAYTDALTGIANRNRLDQQLPLWASMPAWTVGAMDLDRFKPVNDTYGHKVGDKVLKVVARRLIRDAGSRALVARVGGDEFVILLPVHPQVALPRIQRCVAGISQPMRIDGIQITIGASAGIAAGSREIPTDELLHHADMALYDAKTRRGQNRVSTSNTPDTNPKNFSRLAVRDALAPHQTQALAA